MICRCWPLATLTSLLAGNTSGYTAWPATRLHRRVGSRRRCMSQSSRLPPPDQGVRCICERFRWSLPCERAGASPGVSADRGVDRGHDVESPPSYGGPQDDATIWDPRSMSERGRQAAGPTQAVRHGEGASSASDVGERRSAPNDNLTGVGSREFVNLVQAQFDVLSAMLGASQIALFFRREDAETGEIMCYCSVYYVHVDLQGCRPKR